MLAQTECFKIPSYSVLRRGDASTLCLIERICLPFSGVLRPSFINCFTGGLQAFEEDGGFTLGDKAKLLLSGEPADLEKVAHHLQNPQPEESES